MDFLQWQGWICLAWLLRSCAGTEGMLGCPSSRRASEGLLAGAAAACTQASAVMGPAKAAGLISRHRTSGQHHTLQELSMGPSVCVTDWDAQSLLASAKAVEQASAMPQAPG